MRRRSAWWTADLPRPQRLPGDQAGGESAQEQVEPELGGEQRQRGRRRDDPAPGELRARLDGSLDDGMACRVDRTAGAATITASATNPGRISAFCSALCVEPASAAGLADSDRPGREQ